MPTQSQIFFNQKWSKFVDNSFLTNLEFFAYMEKRPLRKADREIMKKVTDWLNPKRMWQSGKAFGHVPVFTRTNIYGRFEFAELRYNTWKQIIEYEGVNYNPLSNTINPTPEIMFELCKMHSLGEAYLFEPEYRWKEMQVIFGPYGSVEFGPTSSSKSREYSRMIRELLADIAREETDNMEEDETSSDDEVVHPRIQIPDVMSTTKGKGHILEDPIAKVISSHLRMAPVKTKEENAKTSCSSAVKKLLKF